MAELGICTFSFFYLHYLAAFIYFLILVFCLWRSELGQPVHSIEYKRLIVQVVLFVHQLRVIAVSQNVESSSLSSLALCIWHSITWAQGINVQPYSTSSKILIPAEELWNPVVKVVQEDPCGFHSRTNCEEIFPQGGAFWSHNPSLVALF